MVSRRTDRQAIRIAQVDVELGLDVDVAIARTVIGLAIAQVGVGQLVGQRQRVNIARGFITPHPVLLLDEPTNGLDVMTTRALREFLLQLKAEGRCVIFSSHTAGRLSSTIFVGTSFGSPFSHRHVAFVSPCPNCHGWMT